MIRRVVPLLAVVLGCALFASAAAAESLFVPGEAGVGGNAVRFWTTGTGGYKVEVYAPVGPHSKVTITVENHKGAAQYVATGSVSSTKVSTDFGQIGRISLRFRPSGTVLQSKTVLNKQCPAHAAARLGTFVGTFRFEGEGGYTKVTAHKVQGGVGAPTAPFDKQEQRAILGCHQEQRIAELAIPANPLQTIKEEEVKSGPSLGAIATTTTGKIFFAAGPVVLEGGQEKNPITFVFALLQEEVEGIRIGRVAFGGGKTATVLPVSASGAATLTPGAPFTGSATYTPSPTGPGTLTGNLAIPLPGAGPVPLTGPTFQAYLIH